MKTNDADISCTKLYMFTIVYIELVVINGHQPYTYIYAFLVKDISIPTAGYCLILEHQDA